MVKFQNNPQKKYIDIRLIFSIMKFRRLNPPLKQFQSLSLDYSSNFYISLNYLFCRFTRLNTSFFGVFSTKKSIFEIKKHIFLINIYLLIKNLTKILVHNIIFMNQDSSHKEDDSNFCYYHEFCRLNMANTILLTQLRELVNQRNQISNRFFKTKKKYQDAQLSGNDQDHKAKRIRRTANQIQRRYRCPADICQKSYGAEGSLNQHIKLKHPEIFSKMLDEIKQERDEYEEISQMGHKSHIFC